MPANPMATRMAARSMPLADGDAGVDQTIRAMRSLIDAGKKDPGIHELAACILRQSHVRAFDLMGEARAVYEWVRRNVRFTRDVYGKETLHAAPDVVRLGIGDCDDFTILMCSLLGTIGHQTRIVTIAGHAEDPGQFSHVYPEVCISGRWVPMDAARRAPRLGLAPKLYFRKRLWSSSSDQFEDVAGLNGYAALPRAASPRRRFVHGLGAVTAGNNPRQLPAAFRFSANPNARRAPMPAGPPRHQSLIGLGHYGQRALRGLGDASTDPNFDASTLANLIAVGTSGAATIIKAENAPAVAAANPYASLLATNPALYSSLATNPFSTISPTTLLLGGALLVGAIVLMNRNK
jgi:predicted transglutaminase-like cysteine proteinase